MNVVYDMVYGLTFSNTVTIQIFTHRIWYTHFTWLCYVCECVLFWCKIEIIIHAKLVKQPFDLEWVCIKYTYTRHVWSIEMSERYDASQYIRMYVGRQSNGKKKMLRWFSEMDSPCQTIRNHAKANFRNYSNHSENMRGGPFQHALPLVTKIIIFHPHIVARLACG